MSKTEVPETTEEVETDPWMEQAESFGKLLGWVPTKVGETLWVFWTPKGKVSAYHRTNWVDWYFHFGRKSFDPGGAAVRASEFAAVTGGEIINRGFRCYSPQGKLWDVSIPCAVRVRY